MFDERYMKETMHKAVPFFEDAPCYELEEILELQKRNAELAWGHPDDERKMLLLDEMNDLMKSLKKRSDAPEKIYLWEDGKMPALGNYTDNSDLKYNHDPEFKPYMYAILVPEDVTPKGAVVVCAGGDHGDCTMHEGYQTCRDMVALGYQCFLLLNRTNNCPYDAREAGADASRAIRMVRANAAKYRIDENKLAFAGFSNGGLTAEACVQYYSGTQTIKTHFEDYEPCEYDNYYGSPDAIICVYGPRFKDAKFDYTNVVYPPTFFAVGKDDFAMPNLEATLPDLMAHHVNLEVHTFAGVPHGQSGIQIYGEHKYPAFELWPIMADQFIQNVFSKSVIKRRPDELDNPEYRFDAFDNGKALLQKKKGHLPPMGWNSWNAFGSGNTEKLTKEMTDAVLELGLDKLGYKYMVLDDGCYKPVRVEGKLSNEDIKFPGGFKALSDYIHSKGLKFGMYNDIGTNLCAGAAVGTCGHEAVDAQCYADWGVDFLKVDNCYYLWDNATFSDSANAKYVFAPAIKGIKVTGNDFSLELTAKDACIRGEGVINNGEYLTNIGTFDGTGPAHTPVGAMSGEAVFTVETGSDADFELTLTYATGMEEGIGSWLQLAVGEGENSELFYDDFLPASDNKESFRESPAIKIRLKKGKNLIRLMNHRRQENTLASYATLLKGLNDAKPDHDIIFSICEWGKTQPQNWGYKVGDSWRILNDITFRVGADGDPGYGSWTDDYTPSVCSQYNKAVIMDEFAGLDKGWNDPDMLMIGMNGLTENMQRTHMAMWCMMNAPLMLGLDLRRVKKNDAIYNIIANEQLILLNQDALGIPAKRIFSTASKGCPDTEYIRDNSRVDILAKPLADGGIALSFINLAEEKYVCADNNFEIAVSVADIVKYIGHKMVNSAEFEAAKEYLLTDLWSGARTVNCSGKFMVNELGACDNITIKVTVK